MMSFEEWLNSELAVNVDPDFYLDAYDAYSEGYIDYVEEN